MAAPYGVNLSALATYTDQISFELITQAVAGSRIAEHTYLYPGNSSGTVAVPLMRNQLQVQAASGGWNPGSTFGISQALVSIADLEVKTTYSPYDFRNYYTSVFLNASGQLEDIPFEKQLTDLFVEQISLQNEEYFFNGGDPAGLITGFVIQTTYGGTGSTSIGGTIGYPVFASGPTGPTSSNLVCWTSTVGATSNALTQVDAMIAGLTATVWNFDDLTLYCSIPSFMAYIRAGVNANLFHYDFGNPAAGKPIADNFFYHPGTNVKVVPFAGLNTSCHAALGPKRFNIYAFGLEIGTDYAKIFYDPYNDFVKYMAKWRIGQTIIFPEYWVTNSLA